MVKSQKGCSKKIRRIEHNVNRSEYVGSVRTQNKHDMVGTASETDNHDADQSTSFSDANEIDEQHHTSSDTDYLNLSASENELDIQTNERYDINFGENIEEDVDEQESSDEVSLECNGFRKFCNQRKSNQNISCINLKIFNITEVTNFDKRVNKQLKK